MAKNSKEFFRNPFRQKQLTKKEGKNATRFPLSNKSVSQWNLKLSLSDPDLGKYFQSSDTELTKGAKTATRFPLHK
jgi:hypothetical protein